MSTASTPTSPAHAPDDLPPETLTALGAIRLSPAAARRPALPGATGARAWNALVVKLTDVDPERLAIGHRVEMTFRRLWTEGGVHNYFWKAKPQAAAVEVDS